MLSLCNDESVLCRSNDSYHFFKTKSCLKQLSIAKISLKLMDINGFLKHKMLNQFYTILL